MNFIGPTLSDEVLPQAFGGCRCPCHQQPGVRHVMACCTPTKEELEQTEQEENAKQIQNKR